MKTVIVDHAMECEDEGEYEIVLNFHIDRAEGVDQPRPLHSMYTRFYRVYAWIYPGEEHCTEKIKGIPNPLWDTTFWLPLDDFEPAGKYLHLEVVKVEKGSKDPEPSNNEVLVGRTRIRLPVELSVWKSGPFELVKLHEDQTTKPAGYILVSMQLKREYHLPF